MRKSRSTKNSRSSKINLLSDSEDDENFANDNSNHHVVEIEIHSNQQTRDEIENSDGTIAGKLQKEKHTEKESNNSRSSSFNKKDEDSSHSNASNKFEKIGIMSEKRPRIKRTKTFIKKTEIPPTHNTLKLNEKHKETNCELDNKTEYELKIKDASSTNLYSYEVLTIDIIKTDELLVDSFALKTFVQVHLIDSETNEYIKKTDTQATSRNSRNNSVDYVDKFVSNTSSPMNCSKFQLIWNDNINISEASYEYIQNHRTLIIFFEILEYQETNESKPDKIIAWGFLKPQNNYEQSIRLQLFYPQSTSQDIKCNAHFWWKKRRMRKYPASLYIKLNKETRNNKVQKSPLNLKINANANTTYETEENEITSGFPKDLPILPKLDSLNKKPKHKLMEIPTGDYGCYTLKFSHNGIFLAFATNVVDNNSYKIVIYSPQNDIEYCHLEDHQGFIYDLAWSLDDRLLLSASADNTVMIWDVTMQKLEHILPHPSYVYCCLFYDGADPCIVSGCFDKQIRIWSLSSYELLEEIKEHKGYLTSICFDKENKYMYSADSKGGILKWVRDDNTWKLIQSILNLELKDVIINQIILHQKDRRLIVNCRDGHIRLIDIKTGFILISFPREAIEENNLKCVLTSCSTYLLSGTESGEVYIWQALNGKVEDVFLPYNKPVAIHCSQIEPTYGLFAFCHFGSNLPIKIYGSTNSMAGTNGSHLHRRVINTHNSNTLVPIKNDCNFQTILNKFDNVVKLNHT